MPDKHYQVAVEKDHLKKLSAARPIPALSELIWNALDADATRVDIEYVGDDFGVKSISVRDNGTGMTPSDVEKSFSKLGGLWKSHGQKSKNLKRILHGKEGKGRFKALALGRIAKWINGSVSTAREIRPIVLLRRLSATNRNLLRICVRG